jgi:ribosome-associated protein
LDEDTPPPDERPSKSQRKRDMQALQDLGAELVRLAPEQLRRLALPEALRDAVLEAQRIRAHEGRRRQLQYIGKLMREADAAGIRAAIDDLTGASRESVALMHRCERLRESMIADDDAAADFLAAHPGLDAQWLRAKLRAARLERAGARPPRHARELYQWLRTELGGERRAAAAPPDASEEAA